MSDNEDLSPRKIESRKSLQPSGLYFPDRREEDEAEEIQSLVHSSINSSSDQMTKGNDDDHPMEEEEDEEASQGKGTSGEDCTGKRRGRTGFPSPISLFRKRKDPPKNPPKSPRKTRLSAFRLPAKKEDLSYEAPETLAAFAEESSFGNLLLKRGMAPSGKMKIRPSNTIVPGFSPRTTCIRLEYDIPPGTQKSYHPHPGVAYEDPTRPRVAFLPNNDGGRRLLARFKVAWKYGYMFRVGKSKTTGQDDVVTWTTIPNKTSLNGGKFGFPDPNYLDEAKAELDSLGFPCAEECLAILSNKSPFKDENCLFTMNSRKERMPSASRSSSGAEEVKEEEKSEEVAPSSIAGKSVYWMWKEARNSMDHHDAATIWGDASDCWILYNGECAQVLEEAFQSNGNKKVKSLPGLPEYIVDVSRCIQANKKNRLSA